jgi:hypothetical protein
MEHKIMQLAELKTTVLSIPGITADWVRDNFGDLRRRDTWEAAYDRASEFIAAAADHATAAALDAVWVIGLVIGWCIALWQHFTAPTAPTGPIAEEIKSICAELTEAKPPAKARKARKAKAVVIG